MTALLCGVVLLLLGVPVAVCIGLAAALALAGTGTPLLVVPQQFFANLNNFGLLAIPFFMLTGAIMDTGGVSRRLIDFAQALVGFLRGGIGHVTVVASLFFADISGSATADTAAIGSVMIPGMVRKGYGRAFATALQSAAGSLGLLFPPSMSMIVYAYVANVSLGALFLASLLPGLMVAFSFMLVNHVHAVRAHHQPTQAFSLPMLWLCFRRAFWALLCPVIILGGILGGVFTPVEAGVVAALYVMLVSTLVYRELRLRDLGGVLARSAVNTSRVSLLLGLAFVLGRYLIEQRVPAQVAASFLQVSGDRLLLLVMINVFLILIHAVLETISSIIVVVPVFLPLLQQAHVDPVAFGIVVLVNSAIGINLPPIGFCLYTAASISGVSLEQATRAILPFILALTLDLAIVTLFPQVSLLLPRLAGGG